MFRALKVFGGVLSALFALLMFALCLLAASSTQHKLRDHGREHLEAAVDFVRDRQMKTGVLPESADFERWTQEMDLKGSRFEGNGFTLDKRCGSAASEFCIYFSTGDGFVTYRSWQKSMDKVPFDDSPLPWALGFLIVGVVSGTLAKLLLTSRPKAINLSEAHEG
jgi:hypothetical protein